MKDLEKTHVAYRDNTEGAKARLASLLETRKQEIDNLPEKFTELYIKRRARINAGIVALLGFLSLLIALFFDNWVYSGWGEISAVLTFLLLFSLCVSFCVYTFGNRQVKRIWKNYLSSSGDVLVDIEKFSNISPQKFLQEKLEKLEAKSFSLPLIASMLFSSLCILLMFSGWLNSEIIILDEWIFSIVSFGHYQITLALLAYRFIKKLSNTPTEHIDLDTYKEGWKAYFITAPLGLFSGIILLTYLSYMDGGDNLDVFDIPMFGFATVLLFVVTILMGLLFIAPTFAYAKKKFVKERTLLEETTVSL